MPTYSEIQITFTNDWFATDILKIKTWDNDTNTVNWADTWTWVASRSSGFEVTTGTATATPGERAAINFLAAFDLDHVTGYDTSQATNVVTIKSETLNEDFVTVAYDDEQVGIITVVFSNYVVPPTASNTSLALVRSPYYINTPFFSDTTTAIGIDLYIWEGDLGTVPGTASKSITKTRPAVNYAEFNTNISEILRANINETPIYDITPAVQLIDNNDVKWVYYNASYTDSAESITDVEGYLVATEGYGIYSEGVNPGAPSNFILSDCDNRKVDRNGFVLLPFLNESTITSIDVATENNQINTTLTPTSTAQSSDYIQYISVDVAQASTDNTLTLTFNPSGNIYTFEIVDECRYNPKMLVFKNRYGMYESMTLFKKSSTSVSVESEMFVNNYISGGVYDSTVHQYQKQNIQGKRKITLNSGYISEDENELYEQLLLSDKVFFYEGAYVPVNVVNSNIEFKTRVNDRLVNYSLEFEYAYNIIQNI
jgi:hypothetical protein